MWFPRGTKRGVSSTSRALQSIDFTIGRFQVHVRCSFTLTIIYHHLPHISFTSMRDSNAFDTHVAFSRGSPEAFLFHMRVNSTSYPHVCCHMTSIQHACQLHLSAFASCILTTFFSECNPYHVLFWEPTGPHGSTGPQALLFLHALLVQARVHATGHPYACQRPEF